MGDEFPSPATDLDNVASPYVYPNGYNYKYIHTYVHTLCKKVLININTLR